jgi:NAD(P)-dependent dehydrogenase (short-subunit alcohol dehydrogenase family)
VSSVLVTDSSSGFGELIARTLAGRGHHVYASMRETAGKNLAAAQRLSEWATTTGYALRVVDLDVTGDASVEAAAKQVRASEGGLDAVASPVAAY